jgi:FtsZ-binding cell division protein ZapB
MTDGYKNVIVGNSAGGSLTSGSQNIIIGYGAASGSNTSDCVIIGANAGYNTSNINNVVIGNFATDAHQWSNCTCLGPGAVATADSQVQLGNTFTTVYYSSLATRSDARDKTAIRSTIFGLEFINKLNPVDYKFNYRSDYITSEVISGKVEQTAKENDGTLTRTRYHSGFLAQDLKQVITETGQDFGGYQDMKVSGGEDVLALNYLEFISPMVKAIQELDHKNTLLTNELTQSNSTIANLQSELTKMKTDLENAINNISSLMNKT